MLNSLLNQYQTNLNRQKYLECTFKKEAEDPNWHDDLVRLNFSRNQTEQSKHGQKHKKDDIENKMVEEFDDRRLEEE